MRQKIISALTAAMMIFGSVPWFGINNQAEAADDVKETLFDAAVVDSLHIQPKTFANLGDSQLSVSVAGNFEYESSSHVSATLESGADASKYPADYNYYKSSNSGENNAWEYKTKWVLSDEQKKVLYALMQNGNALQIGGRFDGYYDTQFGKTAGLPYMQISHNSKSNKASLSDDGNSCSFYSVTLPWTAMTDQSDTYYLTIGASKGTTGIEKHRNYARLKNPEVFIQDMTSPKIVDMFVEENDEGNKNFVCGDKIRVHIQFSEPIRVDDYNSAFSMSLFGTALKAVEYSDEDCTVIMETTVEDKESQQISKGNFALTLNMNRNAVKDIAGNAIEESAKTLKDDDVIISGLIPRISKIEYSHADIYNQTDYETVYALQNKIKPGDSLYVDVYLNQDMEYFGENETQKLKVKVGSTDCDAVLAEAYRDGVLVSSDDIIQNGIRFNKLRYCLTLPDTASDKDEIYIDAQKNNGKWELINTGTDFKDIKGNLILTEDNKRKDVNTVTTISADGERILPRIYIDSQAPTIMLMQYEDGRETDAGVYDDADSARKNTGKKENTYTVYFKADEEVLGDVKAKLIYEPTSSPDNKVIVSEMSMGAYTETLVDGMNVTFTVPDNIDSYDWNIYIETEAIDSVYNKSVQRFYLAADTKAPNLKILDKNIEKMSGERAMKYVFSASDAASPDNLRVYYKNNAQDFAFVDNSNNFSALTDYVSDTEPLAGTMEYYAEDGSGNKTDTRYDNFYSSGVLYCNPTEESKVTEYLESRDIEFEGFEAPEGNVYDYFAYKIDDDSDYTVQKYEGTNPIISKDVLHDGAIITYKRFRSDDSTYDDTFNNAAAVRTIYHCDDTPPEIDTEITRNDSNNISIVTIAGPKTGHPNNIMKFELTMAEKTLDVTDRFVSGGYVLARISMDNVLKMYNLPSGEYSLKAKLTDANGHVGEYTVFENESIIVDAPFVIEPEIIQASTAETDYFSDSIPVFAKAQDNEVTVTSESVEEMFAGNPEGIDNSGYRVRFKLAMRYEGSNYPVNSGSLNHDLTYTVSYDGGTNWTSFKPFEDAEVMQPAQIEEINGLQYAVYSVSAPIENFNDDNYHTAYIKVKCGANPYDSDILKVNVIRDTSAPLVSLAELAVGNDSDGWNENIDYTNDYIKIGLKTSDSGFYDGGTFVSVTNVINADGSDVTFAWTDYVEITDNAYAVIKENCKVTFEVSDIWGNKTSIAYECTLIDDISIGYDVLDSNDGVKYVILKNITNYVVSAEAPGSTEITDAGIEKFGELSESGFITFKNGGEMSGYRSGDKNAFFGIMQNYLTGEDYEIMCCIYDRYGGSETFKVTDIVSNADAIEVLPFTSTVTDKGNVIRAVQYLEFNKPVAQISSDMAEELNSGMEFERENIYMRSLTFSDNVYAVLDSKTQGNVYVIDRYRQIYKVEVNTEGTVFVDYNGYSPVYSDSRNGMEINGNSDYIYGSNSNIKISVSGNNGISTLQAFSDYMTINGTEASMENGMEYYGNIVLTADTTNLTGEGTLYAADLKIRNTSSGEEYSDVIVIKYQTAPPQFITQYKMERGSIQEPQKVVYVFYDRYGFDFVEDNMCGSDFIKGSVHNGIYYVQYTQTGTPTVKVTDTIGNELTIQGPQIDDVQAAGSLTENIDYTIKALDSSGNPVTEGTYYTSVSVGIEAVAGGKAFTVEPEGMVTVNSENAVIFELTDEESKKQYVTYNPPVDITPPSINVMQNNSGSMASSIIYSILVNDVKSGIDKVYVKGAGINGGDLTLSAEETSGNYAKYLFTANNADEYTICAVDKSGNISEATAKSNTTVVGNFAVNAEYSEREATNKNVKVKLTADDGRRIYTRLESTDMVSTDYMIIGNTVSFKNNGSITVSCTDELGFNTTKTLIVTNMDITPPSVTYSVENVYDDAGNQLTGLARVRFEAEGSDNGAGLVELVRLKDNLETINMTEEELLEIWTDYTNDPNNYIVNVDFKTLCSKLFFQDITLDSTYVDVDENGYHVFFFVDRVGNIAHKAVYIDSIDETKPNITNVQWDYNYLSAPDYTNLETSTGTAEVKDEYALIDKNTTGHLTNQSVKVTVTADEPVIIYGEQDAQYSTTVEKVFTSNGIYRFVVEDRANNQSTVTVDVDNICKDDLYIELTGRDDIVIIEGQEDSFNPDDVKNFKVYKYGADGEKVYIDNYTSNIDYGTLNIDDISSNTFDRNSPYTIHYMAWDEAGNKAELTRRVVLCGADDIMVTVNGQLPDSSNNIFIEGNSADIEINNYYSMASVKLAKGQFNGAQMKTKGDSILAPAGKCTLEFNEGGGWYTIGVRTLYQDIYTIRVYVSQ